jgi:hypothetical protein
MHVVRVYIKAECTRDINCKRRSFRRKSTSTKCIQYRGDFFEGPLSTRIYHPREEPWQNASGEESDSRRADPSDDQVVAHQNAKDGNAWRGKRGAHQVHSLTEIGGETKGTDSSRPNKT